MEHLNNIGYNKIDRLQTKEISQVHLADPYLNSNDINKIATTNLGDSFTFVFNVGNTKTVSLVNNIQDKQKNQVSNIQNTLNNSTLPILEITNNNINNDNDNDNTIQSNTSIQQIPIEPTIRQQKIISVLEKHINDKITPGDSGKMFYKFLDNKLQIEDYKSLNTIIGNLHIPNNYKETYLKVVEIFISMLVKEKSKVNTVLSWYIAPSLPNTFVLEYFPVGSSKSKFLLTPTLLRLIAFDLIIELYNVYGKLL
jgi:hypothetical protein